MFRRHWREPAFWRWWWANQAPHGAKVSLAGLAVIAFLAVGFLAAVSLSEADAGRVSSADLTFETTVDKLVTVRDRGRVVVRRVPIVRRVVYRPETAVRTLVGTRVLTTRGNVRYVPRLEKRLVTVGGKTRTITETRIVSTTGTRTQIQTETSVVTEQQTVVRTETVPTTVQQTVVQTSPPLTVTVTVPVTVTVTVTKL